jgi:hypothetical protein
MTSEPLRRDAEKLLFHHLRIEIMHVSSDEDEVGTQQNQLFADMASVRFSVFFVVVFNFGLKKRDRTLAPISTNFFFAQLFMVWSVLSTLHRSSNRVRHSYEPRLRKLSITSHEILISWLSTKFQPIRSHVSLSLVSWSNLNNDVSEALLLYCSAAAAALLLLLANQVKIWRNLLTIQSSLSFLFLG